MRRMFLVIILMLAGCELTEEAPAIQGVSPSDGARGVASDVVVEVRFSKEMDRAITTGAFSLADETGPVAGEVVWSGTLLRFIPSVPLRRGVEYTITITGNAEDTDGRDLGEDFLSRFSCSGEMARPRVLSVTPTDGVTGMPKDMADPLDADPQHHITVTFSEEMDPDTFHGGLSISPAVPCYYDRTGAVVTLRPTQLLAYGTTYTVTASTTLMDIEGNALNETHRWRFTVGDDFIAPEILSVTSLDATSGIICWEEATMTSGVEKDNPVVLEFTEAVAWEGISSAVRFSPSVDFTINSLAGGRIIEIFPTDPMESDTDYTMMIDTSLVDLQENGLVREYVYTFRTDGAESVRPVVSAFTQDGNDILFPQDIVTLQLNPLAPTMGKTMTLGFSRPMNPAYFDVTVTRVAGTGGNPDVVNLAWDGTAEHFSFDLDKVAAGNTYRITVDASMCDIYGNEMREDLVQLVRF